MEWITDRPLPLMILFVAGAIVAWLTGHPRGRVAAVLCGVAAALVYGISALVVSSAEEVQADVERLLAAFIERDLDEIRDRVDPASPELMAAAEQGLQLVQLGENFHIRDIEVSFPKSSDEASVHLRANGTATLKGASLGSRHVATRWRTTWIRTDDGWILSAVTRLNPVNGEEIGVLDRQG